nr:MAG TPA: hypothetical protein [Caudoviricetes sp.]
MQRRKKKDNGIAQKGAYLMLFKNPVSLRSEKQISRNGGIC